ncbi:MAG TPA: ABC transporter substrate-binding protein [Dictyobacter sp.]|jgi:peptide/nickel transport system substrate-binding protein|nr:ABC transporter substrate-binding protein [Dictyobacter sp.]
MRKPLFVGTVLFLLATFLLTACGGNSTSNSQPQSGGDLKVGISSDAVTLDPLQSSALYDRQIMLNIYDTLVQINAQNQVVPDLATSWTYKTPTELDFTLRTDVKFQDGTPFNADAVVFNINRILNDSASPRFSEISSVKSVQAIDSSHVQFNLKQPFSPLLATLTDRAGMMLSPTAVKKLGSKLANAPVGAGSGPFEFSSWVKNDQLVVKKNPNYWLKDAQGNSLPYLNSITYRPITNETQEYNNLQTGTIQVADGVAPDDIASAKSNSNLVYKQIPGLSFYGIQLNTKSAPLNNVHVREAISWAVNRQEILNSILKGTGVVSNGPIPPGSWAYQKNFTPYTYNVSKAKSELALAGDPNGISFTLLIASGSPLTVTMAQYLQSELQPAGIKMNIKQETFATLLSDTDSYNFQAAFLGWSGRPDPDGNIYSYFHTGGGNNTMQYSNPQVDALLENARTTSDQQTRATDYQQAQQMIMQDAPYVFLYHGVSVQATTTSVKNFTLLPTGIMVFTHVSLSS